jgi:hypothetical protein
MILKVIQVQTLKLQSAFSELENAWKNTKTIIEKHGRKVKKQKLL